MAMRHNQPESIREFYRGQLPWQSIFTLACIRVVYINKFVVGHENLFYRKYSLMKKRLITNVKRENDICLCTHFDNRITPRLS